MAGDRECTTGSPISPVTRVSPLITRDMRARSLAANPIARDVLVLSCPRAREARAAVLGGARGVGMPVEGVDDRVQDVGVGLVTPDEIGVGPGEALDRRLVGRLIARPDRAGTREREERVAGVATERAHAVGDLVETQTG